MAKTPVSLHSFFSVRRAAGALIGLCLGLAALPAAGAPRTADVPDVLRPWIPWVLHDRKELFCPAPYNDSSANQRQCVWPTRLRLDLTDGGGQFAQSWRVFKRGWVALPGGGDHWPDSVRVDGERAVVTDREGVPSVLLAPGAHRVSGTFAWADAPKSLPVPPSVGLIALTVDGRAEPFPDFDDRGNLWLRQRQAGGQQVARRLTVRVFRRIEDDLPMRVTTLLRLDVAGDQREVVLGPVLLAGAIPLALGSPLPARLEPEGRLRVQLRPGTWALTLVTRLPGPVARLTRPRSEPPWPADEVWTFAARTDLRLVEVTGAQTIDPRQTSMPAGWRDLPAYRLTRGDALEIATKRRGDPRPGPDQLQIQRSIWLDFDGDGYTQRDTISGTMRAGWRLDMSPPAVLGHVAVNGQDRFITHAGPNGKAGVELRQGKVVLLADSRVEGAARTLSAVGWDHDFEGLSAVLHLPPGWRLFSVGGADHAATWLRQWTMWSLFHVLIIVLAVAKLWDWRWGVVSLVTMVLVYHESDWLGWSLLSVLAAVALWRNVPEGRMRRAVRAYRDLSLLALVLIAIPFAIDEVRIALYPQLEHPYRTPTTAKTVTDSNVPSARQRNLEKPRSGFLSSESARSEFRSQSKSFAREDKAQVQYQYDPGARITTGPGVPNWSWTTVRLYWSGPVERGQTLSLALVPPWANLVLRLSSAALVGLLAVLMLGAAIPIPLRWPRRGATAAVVALCALGVGVAAPDRAHAELPDAKMLDELRARLLEAPDCFPHCARISLLALDVEGERMSARVTVDAAEAVAVPLPGHHRLWRLRRAELDGEPVAALRRDKSGTLWAHVPAGRHEIALEGALARDADLPVPLPLRPHRVTVQAAGWSVDGIDENGVPQAQIRLVRLPDPSTAAPETLEPTQLPPFVRVERTLMLGLSWRVSTRVVRDPATRGAVVVNLPVLDGEAVTAANVRVRDGRVLVNMTPADREVSWTSTLERREVLTLKAPETTEWTELWRLDASSIWHVASTGLAPVFHQDPRGTWRPVWRPWPGETLALRVDRPAGVEGRTLTIDRSLLRVRPGERATDADLAFDLRSSQGGQHVLRLPENARLDSVMIDRKRQPVRVHDGLLTLPIAPGKHAVAVKWREKRAVEAWFTGPRVDLGAPSVNNSVEMFLPRNRWVLLTAGPTLGPAVLFWGVLLVVVAIGIGLGRSALTPLRWHHWILLGIGLTQASIYMAVLVVVWLFALGYRERRHEKLGKTSFNLTQICLSILTLVALGGLFFAVHEGLLGQPEMQVGGNRSTAYALRWYQDQGGGALPEPGVLSVSIWFYKFLMLAWALWLAAALLSWARWGWRCFSAGGLWRPFALLPWRRRPRPEPPPEPA